MLKIFSVFDSKVGAFMNPIFLRSRGEAVRVFEQAVGSPEHDFCKYPQDFTLFELGDFDPDNAKFSLYSTPYSIGLAIEFMNSKLVRDSEASHQMSLKSI